MSFGQGGGGPGNGNPFGNNPFGAPPQNNPFGAPAPAPNNPFGTAPPGNGFAPVPPPPGGAMPPAGAMYPPAPGNPFGAPPASSPFGAAAGYGAPVPPPPTAGAPPDGMFDLLANTPSVQLPPVCACCAAPSQTTIRTSFAVKRGRVTETRWLNVPYCTRCQGHIGAVKRRGWIQGLVALAAGALVPLVLANAWDYAPGALIIGSGLLVALVALFVLNTVWKEPPVARAQGCCGNGQALRIVAFGPGMMRVRAHNSRYAQQVAQMNNASMQAVKARVPGGARWVLAPLFALLGAIPAYVFTHGTVYFDNPSGVPLTFIVDGGEETMTVAPGAHDSTHLPTGTRQIQVQMNGATVDQFNGDVDGATTHVATPLGTACYARLSAVYGNATLSDGERAQLQNGVRWYTLSNVDYVLEPFPSSVSLGRGESGAVKHRFTRVDCSSGHALP